MKEAEETQISNANGDNKEEWTKIRESYFYMNQIPLVLFFVVLGIEPRDLCLQGKHSTN